MKDIIDKNGNYAFLPMTYRDWHKQKRLFKSIYEDCDYENRKVAEQYKINLVQMHTNTIDVFLYQMALRGYTLQKDTRFLEDRFK